MPVLSSVQKRIRERRKDIVDLYKGYVEEQEIDIQLLEKKCPKFEVTYTKDLTLFQLCCLEILNNPHLILGFFLRPGLDYAQIRREVDKISKASQDKVWIMLTGNQIQSFEAQLDSHSLSSLQSQQVGFKASYNDHLTGHDVKSVILDPEYHAKLQNLNSLSFFKCPAVGDRGLKPILKLQGYKFTELVISGTAITGYSVRKIAKFCPRLRKLDISRTRNVEDTDIDIVTGSCRKLELLDVSYIETLTNKSLQFVGQNSRHLSTLRSIYNPNISYGLGKLTSCAYLQSLYLQHCKKVSSGDLLGVISKCNMLDTLSLRGCRLVSSQVIVYITEHCYCLRLLDVVDTQINGQLAFGVLASSERVRRSLQEFLSGNMTVMHISDALWQLYGY